MARFDFVSREAFSLAFLVALAGSAVIAVTALAYQRWRATNRVFPVAGLVGVGAAILALRETDAVLGDADDLYRGLAALAAAGLVAAIPKVPWFVRLVTLVPGAVLVSDAASSVTHSKIGGDWVRVLVLVAVVAAGTAIVGFDRHYARDGLGPVALAVTAGGVFLCVPDTEQALSLVGAFAAVALLGWPKPLCSLGAAGAAPAVGLVAWTTAVGGRGRPASIVGGIACVGLLLLEPAVRSLLRSRARPAPREPWSRDALVIVAIHLGVVVLCSRLAGSRSSATVAAVVVIVVFSTAGLLLWRRILPAHVPT
ncbi:MAG: hypothetical protein WD598_16000 [Acidimicrobiia bacterium]